MLSLLLCAALAQAETYEEPAPPPPPVAAPAFAPVAAPAPLTAEKLQSLRTYKASRLSLRSETELHGGSATVMGMGYPMGPAAMGSAWVVSDPITTTRTWGVYRGPQRLSVPTFLGEAGATEQKRVIEADIAQARQRSKVWFTVAGVGIAGIVTGMGGMVMADDRATWLTYNRVSFASTGVVVGGLFAGSFPSTKANRLTRYPSATMGTAEAQQLIDAHNEALRVRLALEPADVWQLEAGPHGEL